MAENGTTHWADDEHLLSRYVLHQLDSADETRLSAHLGTCPTCREAVENEYRIAAGARLAGRTAMKERLRSRLSAYAQETAVGKANDRQIPWTRVVSIAAVFLIVVATGVYNNWFSANNWSKPAAPGESQAESAAKDQSRLEMDAKEKDVLAEGKPRRDEPAASKRSSDKNQSPEYRLNKSEPSAREMFDGRADEVSKSIVATPDPVAGARLSETEELKAGNETQISGEAMAVAPQLFWVEGRVVTPVARQREDAFDALSPARSGQPDVLEQRTTKKYRQEMDKVGTNDVPSNISLNQMPLSSLPASQQQNPAGVVQTLFENNAGDIRMTVYLDSLIPDFELQNAGVEAIGKDSLVLNLSNQQIGYKLPRDLQGQVNTRKRR